MKFTLVLLLLFLTGGTGCVMVRLMNSDLDTPKLNEVATEKIYEDLSSFSESEVENWLKKNCRSFEKLEKEKLIRGGYPIPDEVKDFDFVSYNSLFLNPNELLVESSVVQYDAEVEITIYVSNGKVIRCVFEIDCDGAF